MKVVNVGCGATPTKGAINIDNSFTITLANNKIMYWLVRTLGGITDSKDLFIDIIRKNNIKKVSAIKLPFEDNSIDIVYSSHMIEHMGQKEIDQFLSESFRILINGGILRLVTPDFEQQVNHYIENQDADLFMRDTLLGRNSHRGSIKNRISLFLFGDRSHLWLYDKISLSKKLKALGFSNVVVLKPGETTIQKETTIDLSERKDESLYIEAQKIV